LLVRRNLKPPFCAHSRREATLREALTESLEFVFHASWYKELMRVAYHDYENLVKPPVAEFLKGAITLSAGQVYPSFACRVAL
jgi:hypothetical protein